MPQIAPVSRRRLLQGALVAGAAAAWPGMVFGAETPVRGGQLVIGLYPEPSLLTSALTTAGPTQYVSTKLFDGLLTYDLDFKPKPQLATSWNASADGLTIVFKLRPGVKWHDGQPFTSADVAYSVLEVWKKFHARGRSTFANVESIDTPDPLTAIWHLSKPAPYILSALASAESQVVPKHVYEGTDILTNPKNTAPIGTGPFRFTAWERGDYIAFERNPDYWDQPKPYLDRIIFRIIPDAAAATAALETGEVQMLSSGNVPLSDVARLTKIPGIEVHRRASGFTSALAAFEFNLDRPYFKDVRVRRAFAHAIDRDFIIKNIWYGFGSSTETPIPADLAAFHTADVPVYPFDLKKAAALLDEAGYKPDANGIRFSITHDPAPTGDYLMRTAEYLRDTLGKVGIKVEIRSQGFAAFVRRAYTERDFDTIQYAASAGPDPAIGTQRFYWSKNFKPGVAFSNGSHYSNPEVDRLLEAAQSEVDPKKRRDLYVKFQQIVQSDLPKIPVVSANLVTLSSSRFRQYLVTAYGALDNFSESYLLPS